MKKNWKKTGNFLLAHSKRSILTKRWALWLVSKKSYSLFRKGIDFGHFWLLGSTFKVDFLNVQSKLQKILGQFPGQVVRNILWNFGISISAGLRGVSRFASRHFPKSLILASWKSVRLPFVACYTCSIVIFHSC